MCSNTLLMLSVIVGTDENAIIEVLAGHINYERQEIKKMYKTMFGQVNRSREFWIIVITIYRVNKTVETFVISTCIWIVYLQAIDDATCIVFGEVILYLSN